MHRLAEEKQLQERLQGEREKQDRELLEMTLRLERERRDKTITAMFALEKEFIKKKYDLLHNQLEEGDDAASIRSRRSQGNSKVQDWIKRNPQVTVSANTGCSSTGLTLQTEVPKSSFRISSAMTTAADGSSIAQQASLTTPSVTRGYLNSPVSSLAFATSQQVSSQLHSSVQQPLPSPPITATVMQ